MKKTIIIACSLLMPLLSWGQTFVGNSEFSLQIPDGWAESQSPMNGVIVIAGPSKTDFTNNVNVLTQSNLGNTSMEAYAELSIKQIKTVFKGANIMESKSISDKVHQIVYTGEITNKKLQFIQRFYKSGDTFYVITFTATPAEFENLKPTAVKMLDSFQLK